MKPNEIIDDDNAAKQDGTPTLGRNNAMTNNNTDQATPALYESGFALVPLDQPGAPTPDRIADRLGSISIALDKAVAVGDLGAIANGVDDLRRLRCALDEWDGWMKQQSAKTPLSAAEFLAELRRIAPPLASADDRERDCRQRPSASKLFLREAWYEETWCYDEIVVARNEGEAEGDAFAYQEDGRYGGRECDGVEVVAELSLDDLDEVQARAVAVYLARAAERDAINVMTLEQIRVWLKRRLSGDRQQEEGQ